MQSSRFWVEAEAIDLLGLGFQRRAEFLGTQVDPRRSSTAFLEHFHSEAAKLPRLKATGGSGEVTAEATPGTVFIGSTTVPDALATQAHDQAGLRYQVFQTETTPPGGTATLTLVAVDSGVATNLQAGTKLKWINPPSGSTPDCEVFTDFTGGTPNETDQEWGERIFDARGTRPAAGNPAHFRLWARRASNAVAEAFVYPCALNAGSVVVSFLQKRSKVAGPLVRIPNSAQLVVVTGYLTPPSSPVVPGRVHVVVVPPEPEATNIAITLQLRAGSPAGWADATPWPALGTEAATVLAVADQKHFTMSSIAALPAGVDNPQMMFWDSLSSAFVRLHVNKVVPSTGRYEVSLHAAPASGIQVGQRISPYTKRHASITAAIEAYFDSLGPGELVDLATDVRASRAFRRPRPEVAAPYTVGAAILTYVSDALGGSLPATLASVSRTTPSIPATASTGPRFLVPGHIGIYAR